MARLSDQKVLSECVNYKGKGIHTLDIAPLRSESPPQKRSGMARVLKGFHSFTCTPTRSSAIGMSHTCIPDEVLIYRPRKDGRLSRPWGLSRPIACERNYGSANSTVLRSANPGARFTKYLKIYFFILFIAVHCAIHHSLASVAL